jgi:acyl carrier protein
MQDKIEKIIIETLVELNEELENESLENPNSKTKLYGANGGLDSLALVSFITDLEEKFQMSLTKR